MLDEKWKNLTLTLKTPLATIIKEFYLKKSMFFLSVRVDEFLRS